MKPTITKSVKNMEILRDLISSGYYFGEIENSQFVLKRVAFINNLKIFGIDNGSGKYDIKADFWLPMRIAYYALIVLSIILLIIAVFMQKWVAVFLIVIFVPIIVLSHWYNRKKELELFTDKFLSIKST